MGPLEAYIAISANATDARASLRNAGVAYTEHAKSVYEPVIRAECESGVPFGGRVLVWEDIQWHEIWGRIFALQYEIDTANFLYLQNFGAVEAKVSGPLELARIHCDIIRMRSSFNPDVLELLATLDWKYVFAHGKATGVLT